MVPIHSAVSILIADIQANQQQNTNQPMICDINLLVNALLELVSAIAAVDVITFIDAAGNQVGTLTNAPTAGNPSK
jgi:uncharacterized membrane-anchored protein